MGHCLSPGPLGPYSTPRQKNILKPLRGVMGRVPPELGMLLVEERFYEYSAPNGAKIGHHTPSCAPLPLRSLFAPVKFPPVRMVPVFRGPHLQCFALSSSICFFRASGFGEASLAIATSNQWIAWA